MIKLKKTPLIKGVLIKRFQCTSKVILILVDHWLKGSEI
jgi:hypothetical protein